ncbi:hypothetical protein EDC01DRAFT_664005 [Geopyxis carbonaria]|nr:hypothetical protein EDC01DRAFT_664005 [Geopyxis carbonaria]
MCWGGGARCRPFLGCVVVRVVGVVMRRGGAGTDAGRDSPGRDSYSRVYSFYLHLGDLEIIIALSRTKAPATAHVSGEA